MVDRQSVEWWHPQLMFGSLPDVQTWKFCDHSFCMLQVPMKSPTHWMPLPEGPNLHHLWWLTGSPWNDGACNSCLEAFAMSKHKNCVIIHLYAAEAYEKHQHMKCHLCKGCNLHHIWWLAGSPWNDGTCNSYLEAFAMSKHKNFVIILLYAPGAYEKHQHMKCHYIGVPTYTIFHGRSHDRWVMIAPASCVWKSSQCPHMKILW